MEEVSALSRSNQCFIVEWVQLHPLAIIPTYQTPGAAGADIHACLETKLILEPATSTAVPTGFALAIPEGFELQIRPRSGLALHHGILVSNSPGTIDSDYRGEVKIILFNSSQKAFIIEPGMRIAQAVLAPVYRAVFEKKAILSETMRGKGGFGSTGL